MSIADEKKQQQAALEEYDKLDCVESAFDGMFETRSGAKSATKHHLLLGQLNRFVDMALWPRCVLKPEARQRAYAQNGKMDGVWHLEGIPNEEIVTSSVCVLQQENIDPELEFQRRISQCEGQHIFWNISQDRPEFLEKFIEEGRLPIGKYSTASCELVTFPNSHIHKSVLTSEKGKESGTRTTVVFWLRNPELSPGEGKNVLHLCLFHIKHH